MDIEIFPLRVLGSDTTEKILNELVALDDVRRTVIHGPRFPNEDSLLPKYRQRKVINVDGNDITLNVKTGRIFVELTMESTIDDIENICKKYIPFGFEINQSKTSYIRKEKTVSDNIKYGNMDLPDKLIGMTDQYSKISDNISLLRKDELD